MSQKATHRVRSARRLFPLIARRMDALPALPAALLRLEDLLPRGDRPAAEIADAVRLFPALAAKVLRVVNGPFFGLDHRVSTLSHAIAVLGLPAVRAAVAGLPLAGGERDEHGILHRHSLAVAAAAESLAKVVEYDLPEEAAVAGLLHDLGQAVLLTFAPAEALREAARAEGDEREVEEQERGILGLTHGDVGALVAEEWNLPRILKDVIQHHNEPPERWSGLPARHRTLAAIVAAADRICAAAGLGRRPGRSAAGAGEVRVGDEVRFSAEEAAAAEAAARAAADRGAERLGLAVPDSGGGEAGEEPLARAEVLRRRAPEPLAARMRAAADGARTLGALPSAEEVLRAAARLARRVLGMDRALYLHYDAGNARLLGRYVDDDTLLPVRPERIELPLDPESRLGLALREGRPVRVDSTTTDGPLLGLLSQVEVLAAPVPGPRQSLGLLCVDAFLRHREPPDEDLELLGLIAVGAGAAVRIVTLEGETDRLHRLAARDELTGVCNRRSLMELLQAEIDRARRGPSSLSVVMADIDHFKAFNDCYGHQAGDKVLAEVGRLFAATSRSVDVIGRYGGEEFLVVLPGTHVDQAVVYAERIRSVVVEYGARHEKTWPDCPLTISVGATALLPDADDLESLVRRVDRALYAAKARGRNRVCVD